MVVVIDMISVDNMFPLVLDIYKRGPAVIHLLDELYGADSGEYQNKMCVSKPL